MAGEVVFHAHRRHDIFGSLELPCGQCIGCRLERSRQWAMRCVHESKLHEHSCFVTLTYDDHHVPSGGSLDYTHFQKFMKRTRKLLGPVRFFMAGEYGDQLGRPHFHALLFGIDFHDKKIFKNPSHGQKLFTSETLSKLWPYGFASVGACTFESAAYVARYCLKKVTGDASESHYSRLDLDTGEIYQLTPEFAHMSLKPGIGYGWYEKFGSEVYHTDKVLIDGQLVKPPKFYDKKQKKLHPDDFEEIQMKRELDAHLKSLDNTPARLAVKESVTRARLSFKKRSLS